MQQPSSSAPMRVTKHHAKRIVIFVIILVALAVLAWSYFGTVSKRILTPEEQKAAILENINATSAQIPDANKTAALKEVDGTTNTKKVSDKDKAAILQNIGATSAQ